MGGLLAIGRKLVRRGRALIRRDHAACCCGGGEPPCDWYYRADVCGSPVCPLPQRVFVRCDSKCGPDPIAAGQVFRYGGFCLRVQNLPDDIKWYKCSGGQKIPPGGKCIPPNSIVIEEPQLDCVRTPPGCADPTCAAPRIWYYAVPCDCSAGNARCIVVDCESVVRLANQGIACIVFADTDAQGGNMCYRVGLTSAWTTAPDAACERRRFPTCSGVFRSCCACCDGFDLGVCTFQGDPDACDPAKFNWDPTGWALRLGQPVPRVGPCCCSDGDYAEFTIHVETAEFQGQNRATWDCSGRMERDGYTNHYVHTVFGGVDASYDAVDSFSECIRFGGETFSLATNLHFDGPNVTTTGVVSATCDSFVESVQQVARNVQGIVIGTLTIALSISWVRVASNCRNGCGPSVADPGLGGLGGLAGAAGLPGGVL